MDKLPKGWKSSIVYDVADKIHYGYTGKTIENGKFRYLRITDIQNSAVVWEQVPFVSIAEKDVEKYLLNENDIVFARTGATAGKSFLINSLNVNSVFASYLIRIIPDLDKIYPRFLYQYFQSPEYWSYIISNVEGAAQPNFNGKKLANIPIPLPPLPEQKRIVSKLDALFERIDKSIALLEENIKQTEALMASVLYQVYVGMQATNQLGEFDKITAGGTPLRSKSEYWKGNIPWLTSRELNTHFIYDSKEKITELGLKESNAKLFPKGTLLCGMYDTAALKMSILQFTSSCNQAIVGIKPDENKLNIEFLKFQLEYLRPSIMLQRRGVRQKNLNASMIRAIEVWVPTIERQNKLVNFIKSIIAKQIDLLGEQNSKRNNLKALKESILDKAFKGEL